MIFFNEKIVTLREIYECVMKNKDKSLETTNLSLSQGYKLLYEDACTIIDDARQYAYHAVNVSLTIRNWLLGERIAKEELNGADRAEYGKRMIATLAQDLTAQYGQGLDSKSLYNYLKFYRYFPDIVDALPRQSEKVDAVSRQFDKIAVVRQQLLPWTHYRELIRVENNDARKWYEKEALRG